MRRWARAACAATLAASAVANCTPASAADTDAATPDARHNYAPRVLIFVRAARAVPFDAAVASVTVINPEFVTAVVSGDRTVVFTGVAVGEAMVIVNGADGSHRALVVEVRGRPKTSAAELPGRRAGPRREAGGLGGTSTLSFSPAFGGGPSLLRQSLDITGRLSERRTLRVAADLFKFFGGGRPALSQPAVSLGLDRVQLGIDSPSGRLDLLDSVLNVSPLSLNGYQMRGVHVSPADASRLRGAEFFFGLARPAPTLFNSSGGYLGGAILPLAAVGRLRLRAGAFTILSRRASSFQESGGGLVWHADLRYTGRAAGVEGEADYARGAVSWRARADVRRGPFDFYGEALRADRRSPLAALGAQPGGRRLDAFALTWRPLRRFSTNVSYENTSNRSVSAARAATLDSSSLFAGAHFQLTRGSSASLRYSDLAVETGVGASALLSLRTRALAAIYDARFGRRWSNNFEASATSSRERVTGAPLARGVSLREQLRFKAGHWSAAGFFNYQGDAASLAGLVARNPQLLPDALRAAYEADPARFLLANRDSLASLLPGVRLPETRSSSVGARLQAETARLRLYGEARYEAGEIIARERRELLTTVGASLRIDAADTVNLSGARSFALGGARDQAALTISLVHRFGAGRGLGLARLLGLNRGVVEGRVFFDLNADGVDDPVEPGAGGMIVRLDDGRSTTADAGGRFRFTSVKSGVHEVALASDGLGVSVRASTPAAQSVSVAGQHSVRVAFGLTNFGSVVGRIFNDLKLTGDANGGEPGVGGVRLSLQPAGTNAAPRTLTTDASGLYEFGNLAPGDYRLELDPASLPADFRVPPNNSWPVKVSPLQSVFLDIPLAAQRAVAGLIFLDRDGDGRFDPARDLPLAGVRVSAAGAVAVTSQDGSYLLRNLPAGKISLRACRAVGDCREAVIELPNGPEMRGGVNVAFAPLGAPPPPGGG